MTKAGRTIEECALELVNLLVFHDGVGLPEALASVEKILIEKALEVTDGNKSGAAKLLNLKRSTFIEKVKRLEIQ
ncbi:MAG: hypothetical protein CMB99_15845 [Flavobacteriaceae bacterium]|jgi:DNA-binding NtrC family response regulator|nr:hypothetical protein [Flavobacteriaceae bacterium]|tara:strand:- start:3831 stop:4055 length:225 start_codon:yes stop_codon:yes gene_type:complete